jgi:hypothetical protein
LKSGAKWHSSNSQVGPFCRKGPDSSDRRGARDGPHAEGMATLGSYNLGAFQRIVLW